MRDVVLGVDYSQSSVWVATVPADARAAGSVEVREWPVRSSEGPGVFPPARIAWEVGRAMRFAVDREFGDGRVVVCVAVEHPASRVPAILSRMLPLYGAIVASSPVGAVPLGLKASEWRGYHGLRTVPVKGELRPASSSAYAKAKAKKAWLKDQSCSAAARRADEFPGAEGVVELVRDDDNAAEALLIALAGRMLMRGMAPPA